MGMKALYREQLTARIPAELFEKTKSHAIGLGYTRKRGKGFRVDWQGYLSVLFELALEGSLEIPKKGVDTDS